MVIKAITTDSFRDDVLKTRKPVLVKFWAPWCGYCRALAPALESIEKQYESLLSVGAADAAAVHQRSCGGFSDRPLL